MSRCLAVDYGSSSVRVMDVTLTNQGMAARELARAPNAFTDTAKGRFWDHPRLFATVERALETAGKDGAPILGIGADSWGVDVVLVGKDGKPVASPRAYRDPVFNGWMERWFAEHGDERSVFAATGVQSLSINTLYQLYAASRLEPDTLHNTRHALLTADYVHYQLGGEPVNERTLASTSQMLTTAGTWWGTALDSVGLPSGAMGRVVQPGSIIGSLRSNLSQQAGLKKTMVIAPAAHDTQSAIVAVPAVEDGDWAYVSCGTWSIIGVESPVPFTGPDAFAAGLGNETGYGKTYCVQSTVTGLWLIQEIIRILADGSDGASLAAEAALETPFRSIIDPAHPRFMAPANMIAEIRAACREAGEPVPETRAAVARCAYDSLALLYRAALRDLERVTGRRFRRVHMVGGGSRAGLLNALCAAATGLPAVAGPTEATAIGNAIAQFVALGVLSSRDAGRRLVAASFPPVVSEPHAIPGLDDAIARFEHHRRTSRTDV